MKTLELSEASRPLSEYAGALGDEPLVLVAGTEPVAALVSLSDVDRESLALSSHPGFLKIIRAAREEAANGDVVSLEEMKREML